MNLPLTKVKRLVWAYIPLILINKKCLEYDSFLNATVKLITRKALLVDSQIRNYVILK